MTHSCKTFPRIVSPKSFVFVFPLVCAYVFAWIWGLRYLAGHRVRRWAGYIAKTEVRPYIFIRSINYVYWL
jgi:hypothetical protein